MNQEPITADELKRQFSRRGVPWEGVDFAKLADAQNDERRRVPGWSAPAPPSPDWRETRRDISGAMYTNAQRSLAAIISCEIESDGRRWLHLSISHRRRVPTHGEMRTCKEAFLGDRYAYAVWPPKKRYVNLHEQCLHLFALLDETADQPLPDFTGSTGSI